MSSYIVILNLHAQVKLNIYNWGPVFFLIIFKKMDYDINYSLNKLQSNINFRPTFTITTHLLSSKCVLYIIIKRDKFIYLNVLNQVYSLDYHNVSTTPSKIKKKANLLVFYQCRPTKKEQPAAITFLVKKFSFQAEEST